MSTQLPTFQYLQTQMTDLANRLAQAIPASDQNLNTIVDSLRNDIKPILEKFQPLADTVNAQQAQITTEAERICTYFDVFSRFYMSLKRP